MLDFDLSKYWLGFGVCSLTGYAAMLYFHDFHNSLIKLAIHLDLDISCDWLSLCTFCLTGGATVLCY